MPTVLRALLLAVALTVVPVGVGVSMSAPEEPAGPPAYTSTALADYDTTTVTIARGPFCDGLPADAVTAALGRTATDSDAYVPGQRRPISPGTTDVVHEYGCDFTAGPISARAWLFAPPVTSARAADLVRTSDKGCKRPAGAAAYGRPSVATICGGPTRTATYHGLFGDAWLSCSLAVPKGSVRDAALLDRLGKWCVAVAKAASATAGSG